MFSENSAITKTLMIGTNIRPNEIQLASTPSLCAYVRVCVCMCLRVTFRREYFLIQSKMLANSNNANNLCFRCLATDESECNARWILCATIFVAFNICCRCRIGPNQKKSCTKQMHAAKNQTFLVIDCEHIIEKAINNI